MNLQGGWLFRGYFEVSDPVNVKIVVAGMLTQWFF